MRYLLPSAQLQTLSPEAASTDACALVTLPAKLLTGPVPISQTDFGPGLSKQALRKLFQAFGKSATEAAHSAPSVGLGLARSRRLARELSGRLEYLPS
jgi:K+-sensing histidine kinase KdpD